MIEFLVLFISLLIVFSLVSKITENNEITKVYSKIDNRRYLVRKLPDSQEAANKLASLNTKALKLLDALRRLENKKEGVSYLIDRYNPDRLSETEPGAKYTSYSVNKGESISMCLRHPNKSFIDMNIVFFVLVHEMAHVMTDEIGHTPLFWENMGYLLRVASKEGLYRYKDYEQFPVKYCGVTISSNPFNYKINK